MARRAVGIVSNERTTVPQTPQVGGPDTDAHISSSMRVGEIGLKMLGVEVGVGVVN
jgi:hypothetical protein